MRKANSNDWITPSSSSGAPDVAARSRFIAWIKSICFRCSERGVCALQVRHSARVVDPRSLVMSGEKSRAVIERAAEIGRRVDRDVTGQVLILRAQAVQEPCTQRGTRERRIHRPGVQLHDGLRMGGRIGVQPAEKAELIDFLREVRIKLGDPRPGLPVPRELESRGGQDPAPRSDFPVIGLEFRLVVPRVDAARRPLP